jgi:hypothetical protein
VVGEQGLFALRVAGAGCGHSLLLMAAREFKPLVLSTATADDWPHGLAWAWPSKDKLLLTKTRVNNQTYRDIQLLSLVRAGKQMCYMYDTPQNLWKQRMTASTVMHCFYSMVVYHMMQADGSSVNFMTQSDADNAHTLIVGLIDEYMANKWMPLCQFIHENPVVCIVDINKYIEAIVAGYKAARELEAERKLTNLTNLTSTLRAPPEKATSRTVRCSP